MVKTSQEVVSQAMGEMGTAVKEKVVVPLQQQQEALGNAIVELVKRQQLSDEKDGVQDQALAQIIQTLQAAAQMQNQQEQLPQQMPIQ